MMKRSARVAYLFIFLFFLFFNGLQVYLVVERITEAKTKFSFACSDALVSSLNEYNKLKGIDSASIPRHAWIAYARRGIVVSRIDSQAVRFSAPNAPLLTDTLDPAFVEGILNKSSFQSVDLRLLDRIFRKALQANQVRTGYRLDTITPPPRRTDGRVIHALWMKKKRAEYPFATRPLRISQYAGYSVFAQLKYDRTFFQKDLLWPLLAFVAILIIGNTALVFVYRTIRKQKRINEVKTDFINNITHEMKTPITIALAGLQAMEHQVSPTERSRFYLDTSKKQLLVLNDFVERIVDAAVQDVSDFTLKKERFDLRALFEEAIRSRSVLPGKPVSFNLAGEGPVYIHGDRLHLQTAFHNIIDNAIKYSYDTVAINIDIADNSRESTVRIRDNGMGIPPQFLKNIFEKFFRVPQGDAQSIKGFGLGLYYVSNIVKKHSGSISVRSKDQAGTEFIIILPKHP